MWSVKKQKSNYVSINVGTWSDLEAQASADLLLLHGLSEKRPDKSFIQTIRVETAAMVPSCTFGSEERHGTGVKHINLVSVLSELGMFFTLPAFH